MISDEKLQGIAPGQFGVVYDATSKICIGSGEIK
jgi:tRNA-specific 2-thiouridylase